MPGKLSAAFALKRHRSEAQEPAAFPLVPTYRFTDVTYRDANRDAHGLHVTKTPVATSWETGHL
jgi:hypothetical protein